jgi:hypothetical protein
MLYVIAPTAAPNLERGWEQDLFSPRSVSLEG